MSEMAMCRHIHVVVDLSGSMYEKDSTVDMSKRDIVLKSLNDRDSSSGVTSVTAYLAQDNLPRQVLDRLGITWLSIGFFGDSGYREDESYLFNVASLGTAVNMRSLREKLVGSSSSVILDPKELEGVNSNGTDAWQIVNGFKSAVRQLGSHCGEIKSVAVVLTDACFNKKQGSPLHEDL